MWAGAQQVDNSGFLYLVYLCICVLVDYCTCVFVYLCIFTGIQTGAGAQQVADNLTFMLPSLKLSPHQM